VSDLKSKSIKGIFWDLTGKFSLHGIGFIISIFLARLLSPEEFGLIGMVIVIFPITQVFIDMGFGAALIQKKEVSQKLYSSIFWINIVLGGLLTIALYFSANLISEFYKREELSALVKTLSLIFIISSFGIVQNIHFTRSLNFKTHSIIAISTSLISGICGITLAYSGYGVWALVYQKLLAITLSVILYWIVSKWRPNFYFSIREIKSIWEFSSKHFLDRIISVVFEKLDIIMIGKIFNASLLGFYSRSRSVDTMVNIFSSGSLIRVFFPVISKLQNDLPRVRTIYEKSFILIGFISIGLTAFLYVVADDLFIILFTEKWNYSAQLFKIMAIVGFAYPLGSIMINVILGLGHSGLNLKLGLWKKSLKVPPLFIGFLWGIEALLYALIVAHLINLIINMIYVDKVINLSVKHQLNWIFKPLFIALFIVISTELIVINNIYFSFIIKGGIFIISYLILIYLLDKITFNLLKSQLINLKQYVSKRSD